MLLSTAITVLAKPLPDDAAALKALLLAERAAHAAEAQRLRQIIKALQRHRFGRRAETLPIDQLELALEEVEQVEAADDAKAETTLPEKKAERARTRRANRGHLPAHLPRIETVVDIDDKTCACCRGDLHQIGEDVSERLDVIPAQLRLLVTRRPKYACRACEEGVAQTPAPVRLIEGGLPNEALVAHVLVARSAEKVAHSTARPRSTPVRNRAGRIWKPWSPGSGKSSGP